MLESVGQQQHKRLKQGKDMPRITGKKSPAEIAAQSVAKAVKSAINVAAAKAKAASTIGRTQKRYIYVMFGGKKLWRLKLKKMSGCENSGKNLHPHPHPHVKGVLEPLKNVKPSKKCQESLKISLIIGRHLKQARGR